MGSSPQCGKGFFSPRVNFSTDSYTVHTAPPPPPHVQLHASTSVHTFKIPKRCQPYQLFGHTTILHTLIGMGSTALLAAALYLSEGLTAGGFGNTQTACNTIKMVIVITPNRRRRKRKRGRRRRRTDVLISASLSLMTCCRSSRVLLRWSMCSWRRATSC